MEYPIHTETIEHCGVTVRIEYFLALDSEISRIVNGAV